VVLEMQESSCGPVSHHEDAVATIDRRWAADILAGFLSPITVLQRRLGRPLPNVISAAATAAGKQPLRRVSWRKRLRRHLGPILLPYDGARLTLHFDFDQVTGLAGKVEYEIEATATGLSPHHCEHALRRLFSDAGIDWQPLTVPRSPVPATAQNEPSTTLS
jgi:hypothetical protein